MGSLVVACGLSRPAACGILVPQPGIEPASPALEGGFLTTGPLGKSPGLAFIIPHNSLEIDPGCCVYQCLFFLLLTSILWYGCTVLKNNSPIEECLSFRFLAIANKAATHKRYCTGLCVNVPFLFLWHKCPCV